MDRWVDNDSSIQHIGRMVASLLWWHCVSSSSGGGGGPDNNDLASSRHVSCLNGLGNMIWWPWTSNEAQRGCGIRATVLHTRRFLESRTTKWWRQRPPLCSILNLNKKVELHYETQQKLLLECYGSWILEKFQKSYDGLSQYFIFCKWATSKMHQIMI